MKQVASATRRRPGAISPVKLAHIVLRTPRFQEMIAWYVQVLDARVVFESPILAFLTYDEEHHRVAFVNQPQLADRDAGAAGVDHVAFTYASLYELVATYDRLKAAGLKPYWCINHGPTTSLYYRDPDRNQVELQIDNFDDLADLDSWMASGAFDANPIGVEFDPDLLSELLATGAPPASLLAQGAVVRP